MPAMRAIAAMQTAWHNSPWYRPHRTRPCTKRKGAELHVEMRGALTAVRDRILLNHLRNAS